MRYLSGERRIPARRWWKFVRKAPEVWLLNVFDLVRPPIPDVLVLVEVTPEEAMAGIRSRGETLEKYQNEKFLSDLLDAYHSVTRVMERRTRVVVLKTDLAGIRANAISDEVEKVCRGLIRQPDSAAPGR